MEKKGWTYDAPLSFGNYEALSLGALEEQDNKGNTSEEKKLAQYALLIDEMNDCVENGIGSPMKIKKELDKMAQKLGSKGWTYDAPDTLANYAALT